MKNKNQPDKVFIAIELLWISVALSVISIIFSFSSSLEVANASGLGFLWLIVTLCLSFFLMAFFIWKIGQGKNWARITYLVLLIIGFPFTIYSYFTSALSVLAIVLSIFQEAMLIVALVFLFQKSSSDWFKSIKNEKGLKEDEDRLFKEEYIKEKARLQARKEHNKK
jgi:hypothetical protein